MDRTETKMTFCPKFSNLWGLIECSIGHLRELVHMRQWITNKKWECDVIDESMCPVTNFSLEQLKQLHGKIKAARETLTEAETKVGREICLMEKNVS